MVDRADAGPSVCAASAVVVGAVADGEGLAERAMKMVAYTLGWLACSVGTYLVWRHDWRKCFREWRTGDRQIALFCSLLGPFALIAVIITAWVVGPDDKCADKPAKW